MKKETDREISLIFDRKVIFLSQLNGSTLRYGFVMHSFNL